MTAHIRRVEILNQSSCSSCESRATVSLPREPWAAPAPTLAAPNPRAARPSVEACLLDTLARGPADLLSLQAAVCATGQHATSVAVRKALHRLTTAGKTRMKLQRSGNHNRYFWSLTAAPAGGAQ